MIKKQIATILLCGLFSIVSLAQQERLEKKLMDCLYENYEDNGEQFKKVLHDYENLLITENILENKNGQGYRNLFEKIAEEDDFSMLPSQSFMQLIRAVSIPQNDVYSTCIARIIGDSETIADTEFKFKKIADRMDGLENVSPFVVSNIILEELSEEDFELDYYKFNLFIFFDVINTTLDSGIRRKLPPITDDVEPVDLSNALFIYITHEDQIVLENTIVTLEILKERVRTYVSKSESETVISLKSARETSYTKYIEVQNAIVSQIHKLRNLAAIKTYNVPFEELTKEQSDAIKKIYPLKLVE